MVSWQCHELLRAAQVTLGDMFVGDINRTWLCCCDDHNPGEPGKIANKIKPASLVIAAQLVLNSYRLLTYQSSQSRS